MPLDIKAIDIPGFGNSTIASKDLYANWAAGSIGFFPSSSKVTGFRSLRPMRAHCPRRFPQPRG
jgi:hypothetical protein